MLVCSSFVPLFLLLWKAQTQSDSKKTKFHHGVWSHLSTEWPWRISEKTIFVNMPMWNRSHTTNSASSTARAVSEPEK